MKERTSQVIPSWALKCVGIDTSAQMEDQIPPDDQSQPAPIDGDTPPPANDTPAPDDGAQEQASASDLGGALQQLVSADKEALQAALDGIKGDEEGSPWADAETAKKGRSVIKYLITKLD